MGLIYVFLKQGVVFPLCMRCVIGKKKEGIRRGKGGYDE